MAVRAFSADAALASSADYPVMPADALSPGMSAGFSPSRRGLIGAALGVSALALPVAGVAFTVAQTDPALEVVRQIDASDAWWNANSARLEAEQDMAGFRAAEDAWSNRSNDLHDRLLDVPATTPAGMAAKLRIARELQGSATGAKLIDQVIAGLERLS